jgi:hypothetical protein
MALQLQCESFSVINYKTWDGSKWTAKLNGTTFTHAPDGDFSKAHDDSIINYITWGGDLWTAKVNNDFSFLHAPVPAHQIPTPYKVAGQKGYYCLTPAPAHKKLHNLSACHGLCGCYAAHILSRRQDELHPGLAWRMHT